MEKKQKKISPTTRAWT